MTRISPFLKINFYVIEYRNLCMLVICEDCCNYQTSSILNLIKAQKPFI